MKTLLIVQVHSIALLLPKHGEKLGGSVNLYHECGSNGLGIPQNMGGGGYARTGQAYIDIILWLNNEVKPGFAFEGNFVGVPLSTSLNEGHLYYLEFYVSLLDSIWYATKNIGIHFSEGQPPDDLEYLLDLEPQVKYMDSMFLDDKEGWMVVSGNFIAEGGENFLTIGNFDGYDSSEAIFVGNGGIPPPGLPYFWEASLYFIDDVSVVEDTSYHVGLPEIDQRDIEVQIYPNPTQGALNVVLELGDADKGRIEISNYLGEILRSEALFNGANQLDLKGFRSGMYFFSITVNDIVIVQGKQVLLK